MQLRVLGGIEFEDRSGLVSLGTPRQRAVLAVLASEAGRVVPADRLIDLLWAGEPPEQALATLQTYISKLRRILEPDRPPRSPATVLVTQAPGYRLVLAPGHLDAEGFERLVQEAREAATTDPAAAEAHLRQALALWRGPAYAEFAHEPWAAGEAARLEELRLGAEEDLLELGVGRGDPDVVSALERHVAAHPLRERARALLALALYRAGRQADALRALEAARRHLRDELGLEPGPSLRALEAAILAQDPALGGAGLLDDVLLGGPARPAGGAEGTGHPAGGPEHDAAPPSRSASSGATLDGEPVAGRPRPTEGARGAAKLDAPDGGRLVVGRAGVLAELDALVEAAAGEHRGAVVVVEGEAGIGKTTIAEAATELVARHGGVSAWGRCQDGSAAPPFWPVVQALRAFVPGLTSDARAAIEPQLAVLAELAPDLRPAQGPTVAPTDDPQLLRLRLFDALSQVFVGPVAPRPPVTLLVLDDVHLADPSSLQLVGALARAVERSSTVVVLTLRPEEVPSSGALVDLLAELATAGAVRRLRLDPLDLPALEELLAAQGPLTPEVAEVVHQRSGGNPFFATELARFLRSEHAADRLDVAARSVPVGVRDVLRRRLSRLPAEAQRLLTVAAVVGTAFDPADVADVADIDLDDALDLLDLAMAVGLVVEADPDGWRFSHALVADAVRTTVSGTRLARWHRRVAEALAEAHGDDPDTWAVIARHHLQAGAAGPAAAVPWAWRAAEHAMDAAAFEQAEALYAELLPLLEGGTVADAPLATDAADREVWGLLVRARLAYIEVWRRGFRSERVDELLVAADGWVTRAPATADAAEVVWNIALHHHQRGELEASLATVGRLAELAERADDPIVAYLADEQGAVSLVTSGRAVEAVTCLDRNQARVGDLAIDVARRLRQSPQVRLAVLRALALWHLGDDPGSRAALDEAVAHSIGTAWSGSAGFARRYGVLLGLMADDPALVEQAAGIELSETRFEGYRYPSGIVAFGLAWAAHRRGDPTALPTMASALAGLEQLGLGVTVPILQGHLATALLERGDAHQAADLLEHAVAVSRGAEPRWTPDLLRRLADARRARGDADGAAAAELEAIALAEAQGNVALLRRLTAASP